MVEHRAAWEVRTTNTTLGFALWCGGRQLHCALDPRFRNLFRGWLVEHLGSVPEGEVEIGAIESFVLKVLPRRLKGLAPVRVDADELPSRHAWLTALDSDRIPRIGEWDHDGWRSNRWDPAMDVPELLTSTRTGRYKWSRGRHGGFKGGGRDPDALEMWLTLAYCDGPFALAVRRRREIWTAPIYQQDGWMSRCALHRLWDHLDATI